MLRELLTDHPWSVVWPPALARAVDTRDSPARSTPSCPAPAKASTATACGRWGTEGLPELVAAGLFLDGTSASLDSQGATDYADLIRRATIGPGAPRRLGAASRRSSSTVPGHRPRSGRPAPGAGRRRS